MADKIPCGGFSVDEQYFSIENKVLKFNPESIQGQGQNPDMAGYLKADGSVKVIGTIDMDGHNLVNITTIGGVHPENDKIGFENEVDMGQHKIINVAEPKDDMDAANKDYVDTGDTILEAKIKVVENKVNQMTPSENKMLHLIETIECQAGTFNIERTQEPNGTPYDFEEIQVYAVFPANTSSDNLQPRVNAYSGSKNLCSANAFGNIQGNKDTMSYGYMAIYQWHSVWEAKAALANGNGWFAPDTLMVNVPPMMVTTYPNIDKIEIFCEDTTNSEQHDMNGMTFHIYGVER